MKDRTAIRILRGASAVVLAYVVVAFVCCILLYAGLGWLDSWWHIPQHYRLEQRPGGFRSVVFLPPLLFVLTAGAVLFAASSTAGRAAVAALSLSSPIAALVTLWNVDHLRFADDDGYVRGLVCFGWLLLVALSAPVVALAAMRRRTERIPATPAVAWAMLWLSGPLLLVARCF